MKYSEILNELQAAEQDYMDLLEKAKEYLRQYNNGLIEMDMPEEMLSELYYYIGHFAMEFYGNPIADLDEIAEYLRKAIALQDAEKYILELANVLGTNRKKEEKIAELEAYIKRSGGTPKTLAKTGDNIILYTEDLEKGIDYFRRAIKMDPENADTYWTYFTDLEEIVDEWPEYFDDAILCLTKIIEICSRPEYTEDMNIPYRYLDLATIYKKMGNYRKALEAVEQSIALDGSRERAWGRKGDLLMEMGRYEEAIPAYETRLKLFENMSNAEVFAVVSTYMAMADCYKAIGDVEGARSIYQKGKNTFRGDWQNEFTQQLKKLDGNMSDWVKIVGVMAVIIVIIVAVLTILW